MPPELRRIWFIWISWISWVCMQLSSFFIRFSDQEWKTVNPDSDSKCSPIMIEEKKWYWISVVFLIVPISAFFVFFGSAQWYDFTAHCQKEKKNVWHVWLLESCVLMVLPSVQCFWEIIQLLALCVLLIWRFHSCERYWPWGLLYWVMQYVTVIPVYKARYWDKDPPPLPLPTLYIFLLMVEKARRILGVESACLWLASVNLDTLIMFICLTLITKVTALREM